MILYADWYKHLPVESGYRRCLARRRLPTRRTVHPETFSFRVYNNIFNT
jgi:hypothetical protein